MNCNTRLHIIAETFLDKVALWCETRGNLDTIKRVKAIRLCVTRYLCGQPFTVSPHPGIGLTVEGLPICLGDLLPLIRDGNEKGLRLVLTILNISRVIPGHGQPDFTSITSEFTGNVYEMTDIASETLDYIKALKGRSSFKPDHSVGWSEPHLSTKSGPNGQAIMSSIIDMKYLTSDQTKDLFVLGGPLFQEYYLNLRDNVDFDFWQMYTGVKDKGITRKLSLVLDPEAKVRVIAICDYWTQTVLKPYHDKLNSYLGWFKADCTFDQSHFTNVLLKDNKSGQAFFSFDLKSATDRLPVYLQEVIFGALFGLEKAKAWRELLVATPYVHMDKSYLYQVGQPMGAYSSWPMMALTHHFIVQLAAIRAGLIDPFDKDGPLVFEKYALLGDDIVINDSLVAKCYLEIMKSLGVEISPTKSHVSYDTFEFAKRWFHHGKEITPAPLKGLWETGKRYHLFIETLKNCVDRWDTSLNQVFPDLLRSYLKKVRLLPLSMEKDILFKAIRYWAIPRKEDSPELTESKIPYMISHLMTGSVGCSTPRKQVPGLIRHMLAWSKAILLQSGYLEQTSKNHEFAFEFAELYTFGPSGVNDQFRASDLPIMRVSYSNLFKVGEEYEKLLDLIQSNRLDDIWDLGSTLRLELDLKSSFSLRQHELVAANNAWLARLVSQYDKRRQQLLSSDVLPDDKEARLLQFMQ